MWRGLPRKVCASAQDSWQVLMFEGKTCSHSRAFTNTCLGCGKKPQTPHDIKDLVCGYCSACRWEAEQEALAAQIEMDGEGVVLDIDTPEALANYLGGKIGA